MTSSDSGDSHGGGLLGESLALGVLRHRRLVVRAVGAVTLLVGLVVLLQPRTWTARGSFVPRQDALNPWVPWQDWPRSSGSISPVDRKAIRRGSSRLW